MEIASRGITRQARNIAFPGCRIRWFTAVAALALSLFSAPVFAFDPEPDPDRAPTAGGGTTITESYDSALKGAQTIDMLGADLFGDRTNLPDGATSFSVTDVSLNTNSGLPVSVGRRLAMNAIDLDEHGGTTEATKQIFGQYWELDVPYMRGTFDERVGWATWNNGPRCTTTSFEPPGAYGIGGWSQLYFEADKFWGGNWINIPGQGQEELLGLAPDRIRPNDGVTYRGSTFSDWRVACHPTVQNGAGEGFVVVLPDGTRYRFDWIVSRTTSSLVGYSGDGGGASSVMIPRVEVFLYATLVTDRFGNTVTYTYDPANPHRLMSVASNDGATLSLQYDAQGKVRYIDAGSRRWEYVYSGAPSAFKTLTDVILPDQSRWQYGYDNLYGGVHGDSRNLWQSCTPNVGTKRSDVAPSAGEASSIIIAHPSGATGTFKFRKIIHGTNDTPGHCTLESGGYQGHPFIKIHGVPMAYQAASLYEKSITGPGLGAQVWSYTYLPTWTWGSGYGGCLPSGCGISSQTLVDGPDGERLRYVFGNDYDHNSGQLLELTVSKPSATFVQRTEHVYLASAAGQPFPNCAGGSQRPYANPLTRCFRPLKTSTITQDGATFKRTNNTFDLFARPIEIRRESSLGNARTDTVAYHDNTANWMLGQVESVSVGATAVVANTYDPASAALRTQSRFGKLERTLDWYADGTLKTSKDGLNQTTAFETYKRGVPQMIRYQNNDSESVVVDNLGQIASYTNAAGFTSNYQYDGIGRLRKITYPTGDTVSWNVTDRVFEPVATTEYGLAPGHWRLTESTGNARSITYYDARWRPVLSRTFDFGDEANTRRMVLNRYDAANRNTFTSYPQRSIASVASAPAGTALEYDGIGRLTRSRADSELGLLTTTIEYLSGFRKRVTDPRNHKTTIGFQVFDDPEQAEPVEFIGELGVTTTIARDLFGEPETMTRSGTWQGAPISTVRSYFYDAHQRLCKTTEPESGATLYAYDDADNLDWTAAGLPAATACNSGAVTTAQKLDHSYDTRNRLTSTAFVDGAATVTIGRSWTPDGLPATVSASGTTWTYAYNRRRLLESETLGGTLGSYVIGHVYDANGHARTLRYPDAVDVALDPNALGEPSRVGSYATGVRYHPDGALERFTYGNGILHTTSQTLRGLPDLREDAGVLKDDYDWDANGNVLGIADLRPGPAQSRTRTMAYDARDRLASASYAAFGTVNYQYDVLDNMRRTTTPGRDHTYIYDDAGTRRLVRTQNQAGITSLAYTYDNRGNATGRTPFAFTVDLANRLTQVRDPASQAVLATYAYDGNGHRIGITTGSAPRLQLYDLGGRFLYESASQTLPTGCAPASDRLFCHSFENGSTSIQVTTRHLYLGNRLIARTATSGASSTTTYLHTDGIGSPVAESSAAGTVSYRALHEPYGGPANGVNIDGPGYAGHVVDGLTGLSYMQARFYDPYGARFLGVDPVAPGADSFNRYWYANNNPYRYVDPDGRQCGRATRMDDKCRTLAEFGEDDSKGSDVPTFAPAGQESPRAQPRTFGQKVEGAIEYGWDQLINRILPAAMAPEGTALAGGAAFLRLGNATRSVTEIAEVTARGSRYANLSANLGAKEFQSNLIANGYKVVREVIGSNGPVSVLSNGTKTYTIYTASSTGSVSAQVTNSAGEILSKIRLIGP